MMKYLTLALMAAALFMIPGSVRATELALWSEFLPFEKVQEYLPELKRLHVAVYVAVNPDTIEKEEFYTLWGQAQRLGVELRPWLLLNKSDGYWANKWNFDAVEKIVWRLLSRMREHGYSPAWISLDLESPPALSEELAFQAKHFHLVKLWRLLARSSRDGSFCQAQAKYRGLVEHLHQLGVRVHAVTNPFVLHDSGQRSYRAQSALGIPLLGIPWDEVSFMAYRVEFRDIIPNIGPDVVYAYATRARKKFSSRAAIDLGETGPILYPKPKMGYPDPTELVRDYAAAEAAGIDKIHVYSLDGTAALKPELESWVTLPHAWRPRKEFKTRLYLTMLDFFVSLLPKQSCEPASYP